MTETHSDVYAKRHKELLLPCVRVRADSAGGSGTVIYSAENDDGEFSSYVLTNHHVVAGLIKVEKKWSSLLQREIKADVLGIPEVHFFEYRWKSRATGGRTVEADIVAYDPDEDLALLHLRSDAPPPSVARLYPHGKESDLKITMPVYAIGAGLGEPPVTTSGALAQFGREIENREFWLSTAPTIFGNSGGALFLAETHELIGVPSRIAVNALGYTQDAITHLSFAIPISRIYEFLDRQHFRFIYDANVTEDEEAEERRKLREREERRMAASEGSGTPDDPGSEPDQDQGDSPVVDFSDLDDIIDKIRFGHDFASNWDESL